MVLDIRSAREQRAERFIDAATELRYEMGRLCDDLQLAVDRLGEARDAMDRARSIIERSRWRMERVQTAALPPAPAPARPHLRIVRD